jgi:hypothetical protein
MDQQRFQRRRIRGQGITEMALIAPVLCLCMYGIIELGRLFFSYVTVQHAARVAARVAITGTGEQDGTRYDSIVGAALSQSDGLEPVPQIVVQSWPSATASGPGRQGNPGQPCELVEVQVRYTYQPILPFIRHLMPNQGHILLQGQDRKLNEPWVPCP